MDSLEPTIALIPKDHCGFPPLLREIPNSPSAIYARGTLPDFTKPHVAIVGTRKATAHGISFARALSTQLTQLGAVIVSGLAMGIDTAAHQGAVESGGRTVAVLANGLDQIYPKQNKNLADRIISLKGALISEYPPGTESFKYHFLERNRIVSGMCIATIIIEAPLYSGSLVTARCAAEQGREVMVLPGPINHPNYKGSHQLLRDGARLVASIENIIEDLEIKHQSNKENLAPSFSDKHEELIFKTIRAEGSAITIDKLIERTTLEPRIISKALTFLVIKNIIKETGEGYTLWI